MEQRELSATERITQYLNGEISELIELAEIRLPYYYTSFPRYGFYASVKRLI